MGAIPVPLLPKPGKDGATANDFSIDSHLWADEPAEPTAERIPRDGAPAPTSRLHALARKKLTHRLIK